MVVLARRTVVVDVIGASDNEGAELWGFEASTAPIGCEVAVVSSERRGATGVAVLRDTGNGARVTMGG